MAQHGYLPEYDDGWGRGDERARDEWRERGDRDWRRSNREWNDGDRDRDFMFGDEDRGREHNRGFFSRMGEEARSWFRDDEREGGRDRGAWENNRDWPQRDRGRSGYGREHGFGGFQGDYRGRGEQGGFGGAGDWNEGRRSFSAHPDDHYRSWRERQMAALDRDYQDYCRERESQFHQDFDSWRQNRQQQSQQRGSDDQDELVLSGGSRSETSGMAAGAANEPQGTTSPEGAATLGTNNSENSATARGRR